MNRLECEIIAWKNVTNRVINLHAIRSQNISKCTSNISKHTGKFTGKTNQIRLGGYPLSGGPEPRVCRLPSTLWGLAQGPRAQGPTYS